MIHFIFLMAILRILTQFRTYFHNECISPSSGPEIPQVN